MILALQKASFRLGGKVALAEELQLQGLSHLRLEGGRAEHAGYGPGLEGFGVADLMLTTKSLPGRIYLLIA